jgi:hypothetical protein
VENILPKNDGSKQIMYKVYISAFLLFLIVVLSIAGGSYLSKKDFNKSIGATSINQPQVE